MTAPVARYALGGDDNLYLQLGLSVLHTASDEKLALAPSALYNLDVVQAIQDGMQRNILTEARRRKSNASTQLELVRQRLLRIFGIGMGLDDVLPASLKFATRLNAPYDSKLNDDFKEMLKDMIKAVDSVLAKTIVAKMTFKPEVAAMLAFLVNQDTTPPQAAPPSSDGVIGINAPVVKYAVSRGLCAHRGPMESDTGAPTDRLLKYDAPKNIAAEVKLSKALRLPVGSVVTPPAHSQPTAAVDEVMAALCENYAIDDDLLPSETTGAVKDARQVRWEPTGKHAEALATAAALEHAVARCGQLLNDHQITLSDNAKVELENARLCLKLMQMDSLHELSCAAEDGEVLHTPPSKPLVTRPVAIIRGKLHLAHDAGHHEAPSTTTVLSGSRWTLKHIKDNAEFRRENATGGVYKAPAPHELGYLPLATGTPAVQRVDFPVDPTDEEYPTGAILKAIRALIQYGLYYADVPDIKSLEATLNGSSPPDKSDALGTAKSRRSGIWNEMLRDIAISTDRLWTFVRTLSGLIGEDADSLLVTADEASAAAARELQAQRKATNDRIATFQSKIIESLIGSMMKESGLRLDTSPNDAGDSLVVINGETAKQINDLASGESGRPFFEANVALRALTEKGAGGQHKLGEVVAQLNGVVKQLHTSLDAELLSPQIAGASLAELSRPRNSYFVRLREDTTAAIRSAYDKFAVECSLKGMGRVCLWELIEGCDHTLCTRFAEFVGHVLIQNRTSTGVSALYSSRQQLVVNASQARVSLERLLNHAGHYRSIHPTPIFNPSSNGKTLVSLRAEYFKAHNEQPETWASGSMASAIRFAQSRYHKNVERNFRPADQVPPHLRPWIQGLNF